MSLLLHNKRSGLRLSSRTNIHNSPKDCNVSELYVSQNIFVVMKIQFCIAYGFILPSHSKINDHLVPWELQWLRYPVEKQRIALEHRKYPRIYRFLPLHISLATPYINQVTAYFEGRNRMIWANMPPNGNCMNFSVLCIYVIFMLHKYGYPITVFCMNGCTAILMTFAMCVLGPILLAWINFDHSMDK